MIGETSRADSLTAPQFAEYHCQRVQYTTGDVQWVPGTASFLSAGTKPNDEGIVQIYQLRDSRCHLVSSHSVPNGITCSTFVRDTHVALGDSDGFLSIFDVERFDQPLFRVRAHAREGGRKCRVGAIDCVGGTMEGVGALEIVTGGSDGCVRVWDPRTRSPVLCLEPEDAKQRRDCWTVAFGGATSASERVLAAGFDNGDVKLACLRTSKLVWHSNARNGVCKVQFDRKDTALNKLLVTTLESRIRVYDLRTLHQQEGFAYTLWKAHSGTVWTAAHLPQNRDIFATCGGNGELTIYKYKYPRERVIKDKQTGEKRGVPGTLQPVAGKADVAQQPIRSFAWHRDKCGLAVVASFDQTLRVLIVTRLSNL
ncbi:MAG: hypothetical protein MHM6MM_004199 [Cercozoa sp. M6MM]